MSAKKSRFFLIFAILPFLTSCSNVVCDVSDVQATVVFDYHDEDSLPDSRTCIFVKIDGDVSRTESIKIVNTENKYEWRVENPTLLQSKAGDWAGSANVRGEGENALPQGNYRLHYKNMAGEEAEMDFSVIYPAQFSEQQATDFPKALTDDSLTFSEKIAVYDKNGDLLFFGNIEKNTDSILKKFPDADFIRVCYEDNSKKYMCFMPPEYLEKKAEN